MKGKRWHGRLEVGLVWLVALLLPSVVAGQVVMVLERAQLFLGNSYGFPCETCELLGGKRNGLCISYMSNGVVDGTYWFLEDELVGTCEEYWGTGVLRQRINYPRMGPPTWERYQLQATGLDPKVRYLRRDGNYGVRDGATYSYYGRNGTINRRTEWCDGVREGADSTWYDWNTPRYLQKVGTYHHDLREGLETTFRPDGSREEVISYARGVKEGPYWRYGPDGGLSVMGRNRNGRPDSVETGYGAEGEVRMRKSWGADGESAMVEEYDGQGRRVVLAQASGTYLHGSYARFDSTGRMVVRGTFVRGKKDGTWTDSTGGRNGIVTARFAWGALKFLTIGDSLIDLERITGADRSLELEMLTWDYFPPDQAIVEEPDIEPRDFVFNMDPSPFGYRGRVPKAAVPFRFDEVHPLRGDLLLRDNEVVHLRFEQSLSTKEEQRLRKVFFGLSWMQHTHSMAYRRCNSERLEFRLYRTEK